LLVGRAPAIFNSVSHRLAIRPMLVDEMDKPQPKAPPEDEQHIEQQQADDRRQKDQSEKVERDRADAAGRRAREGT
jgi:hypothetical protein